MRNLKAFGLALVAVIAMGAIAATTASANQFHSASTTTTITVAASGTQVFRYETGGKAIECPSLGGSGTTASSTVSEVTFQPTYPTTCTVGGIANSTAHVEMNECDYLFTIEAAANKGPVHVRCPEGKQITITVTVLGIDICTYHIGKQTPAGGADYANDGTSNVTVQSTVTGIGATRTGSAECGAAQSTQGSYTGQATIKCEEDGTQNQVACQVG